MLGSELERKSKKQLQGYTLVQDEVLLACLLLGIP